MNPTLTIDVDPANLDYTQPGNGIEFLIELFRLMNPSKQAEFLAEVYTKEVVLEDLISGYKALSFEDTMIFRKETRLTNAEPIKTKLQLMENDLTTVVRRIAEMKEWTKE